MNAVLIPQVFICNIELFSFYFNCCYYFFVATSNNLSPDGDVSLVGTDELKPFALETESKQTELILRWILGKDFQMNALNDGTIIEDARMSHAIKEVIKCKNGSNLLRIMAADKKLIQKYVSPNVLKSLDKLSTTFKNKRPKWACTECDIVIAAESLSWECCRCFLWFHTECQTIYPREISRRYQYCKSCYIA